MPDRATAPTLGLSRSLRLSDVKPGEYEVVLAVEDFATGQRTERRRVVTVEAR